jgi:hypothetical protein
MRLVTKGNPAGILQKIGQAKNLMSRQIEKMRVTGQTAGRLFHDGIDLRLDSNGIQQMSITVPEAVDKPEEEKEAAWGDVVLYHCMNKKLGAISAYAYRDMAAKSLRYFRTEPAIDYRVLPGYRAVVIYEPTRILAAEELKLLQTLLAGGVKLFLFPGDVTIYNLILAQFGSGLYVKAFATEEMGGYTLCSPDESRLYRIAAYGKGYIAVKLTNTYKATIKDPYDVGLAYEDIISLGFVFTLPWQTSWWFDYLYGSYIPNFLLLSWEKASGLTTDEYPYDWNVLSRYELTAWLATLGDGAFKFRREAIDMDANGWLTYKDVSSYATLSSYLAYAAGSNLYVSGLSPCWLRPQYKGEYDKSTDIDRFCTWMGTGRQVKKNDKLGDFLVSPPYYWTASGVVPPIQT